MQEDFDSRYDPDGTPDDEYFYEHYGKQPPDSGGTSGGNHPLLELLGQFLVIYVIVRVLIFLLT